MMRNRCWMPWMRTSTSSSTKHLPGVGNSPSGVGNSHLSEVGNSPAGSGEFTTARSGEFTPAG
eukprot:7302394-Pyramimonas_sp.AAC.1